MYYQVILFNQDTMHNAGHLCIQDTMHNQGAYIFRTLCTIRAPIYSGHHAQSGHPYIQDTICLYIQDTMHYQDTCIIIQDILHN